MHGQPCPVLVPHPRGRGGDAGDMVFLETIYRAFKCWPEGSRRGARAGVRSGRAAAGTTGSWESPAPPAPTPGSQRALMAPPRRPGQKALQAPGGSLPATVFSGCETGVPWARFTLRLSLPSRGGCPGGGALAVALELASTPWRSGCCSRLASCARSLGPGPTHLLTRASWRGGGRVHPRAPGPFSTLRSPAATRGHFLRPGVYFRGRG